LRAAAGVRILPPVLRFDSISKSQGRQILFMDASASVTRGEKVGLVGPNGSGKTTLLRLAVGEDQPDSGQVILDRGVRIGYFSQDVGDMRGRSVLAETVAGAGEVSEVATELHALEAAMADPEQLDQLDRIVERFGEVQARFDELDGYGLEIVERVPLEMPATEESRAYLETKRDKMGHLLKVV